MIKPKNIRTVLVLAAAIIIITAAAIFISQNEKDTEQVNLKTADEISREKTRFLDSIDIVVEERLSRAKKVTTEVFFVDDFSEYYYAKVIVVGTEDNGKPGMIEIYSKKNNRKLLSVNSEKVDYGFNYSEVKANNRLMYEGQSLIIYEDFNFDGIKDFAFLDGVYSSYAYPSHKVYLTLNRKFVYNIKLTKLVRNNLGMFDVDRKRKVISLYNKSGCCYHDYKEYKVINNSPVLVLFEKEVTENGYVTKTTRKLSKKGKWSKKITREEAYRDY